MLVPVVYGTCGSRNSRRFGRRGTPLKNGNAGPSKALAPMGGGGGSGFLALVRKRHFLVENKGHGGIIWAKRKLFLAYCL